MRIPYHVPSSSLTTVLNQSAGCFVRHPQCLFIAYVLILLHMSVVTFPSTRLSPLQTFQVRRAVVKQSWIEQFRPDDGPLAGSQPQSTATSAHNSRGVDAAQSSRGTEDSKMMECFESNDGALREWMCVCERRSEVDIHGCIKEGCLPAPG